MTFVVMLAPFAVTGYAGETVAHPQLGLRLTVPDGFARDPEREQGDAVFAFQRPPEGDHKVGVFIVVSRMGGLIGREKLDPKALASRSPNVTLATEKWKDFDIEVFRVPEQVEDLRLLTLNAQVPLKPKATQVSVIGEASREAELRRTLQAVLSRLEGQSNWLSTNQRIGKLSEGLFRLAITAGVLTLLAGVLWRAVRGRILGHNRAEPGSQPDRRGM